MITRIRMSRTRTRTSIFVIIKRTKFMNEIGICEPKTINNLTNPMELIISLVCKT